MSEHKAGAGPRFGSALTGERPGARGPITFSSSSSEALPGFQGRGVPPYTCELPWPSWVTLTTTPPLGELRPASHLSPAPSTHVTLPGPPCLLSEPQSSSGWGGGLGLEAHPTPGSKPSLVPAALTPPVGLGPLARGCGKERLSGGTRQTCTNRDPSGDTMGTPRTAWLAMWEAATSGRHQLGCILASWARRRGRKGQCEGAS